MTVVDGQLLTWTFHWLRRRSGRAAAGCWSVTAVNWCRASRWEGVNCESSASTVERELAMAPGVGLGISVGIPVDEQRKQDV